MFPRTFLFLLVCAAIGYLLGRTRGMGLQGFLLGFAFGPLGWGLILLWPTSWIQGPVPRQSSGRAAPEEPPTGGFRYREGPPSDASVCPRCRHPVERGSGACGKCGNVLLPIHYQVDG